MNRIMAIFVTLAAAALVLFDLPDFAPAVFTTGPH